MSNKELPVDMENVMVTFEAVIDRPYESIRKEIQTKMGFYSKLFGTFSIPPGWAIFNGSLLPNGFYGRHLKPEQIISWEPIKHEKS